MRAHRTDLVSLVFGLLFLAGSAWWLLARLLDLDPPAVGWFLAAALILIGVLGLLGALRSSRTAARTDSAPQPVDADAATGPDRTPRHPAGADDDTDRIDVADGDTGRIEVADEPVTGPPAGPGGR